MNIKFKKIHIHHFLSIGDAELELTNKGFCLINGINNNPLDASRSNGSGKSSIVNAIIWTITGETSQGLKSNIPNIYFNDGCWVELTFDVDGKEYILLRSKDDKKLGTNLKITVDGNSDACNGKGIRESTALLQQHLPDLTSELLGSVIILGQGLPQKFTANTPSGRKEVLEHLSKSDFMIQDIKERINRRIDELNSNKRTIEDAKLQTETLLLFNEEDLLKLSNALEKMNNKPDFDSTINLLSKEIEELEGQLKILSDAVLVLEQSQQEKNKVLTETRAKQHEITTEITKEHYEENQQLNTILQTLNNTKSNLVNKIRELKAIKDVCPTCGQKIPDVHTQDTTSLETELEGLEKQIGIAINNINVDKENYNTAIKEIQDKFTTQLSDLQTSLAELTTQLSLNKTSASKLSEDKTTKVIKRNQEISLKDGFDKELSRLEKEKEDKLSLKVKETKHLEEQKKKLEDVGSQLDIINKMNTLVKRDFRGFLLLNSIEFLNERAKTYASKIFETDDLKILLDGNNIDIVFQGKDYDNLSGGEKQRIDLIVQFSLRDMLKQHLNFSANILVLDEIFDNLDSVSCDKVINFITNEINDVESVFIISHHADELGIGYDTSINIVKDINGVSSVI